MTLECQKVDSVGHGPDVTGHGYDVGWRRETDGSYSIAGIGATVPIDPAMFRSGHRFLPAFKDQFHKWNLKFSLGRQFFEELTTPTTWALDKPSPFEEIRVLVPDVNESFTQRAAKIIAEEIPAFDGMRVREVWAGVGVNTPDYMPMISPVKSVPGLNLLTGFSDGLTQGPGAGKLMADLITGQKPQIDPSPYRYERYIDGTRLSVIP